ncbi:MAG: hypothetical protein ACYC61_12445 [Isosphaeraceae bacterium]
MRAFGPDEVHSFTASLTAQMDRCDSGEGTECATLDAALTRYAGICCEFREAVRQWARAVFSGRVEFDPSIESFWIKEGFRLYMRAMETWRRGQKAEVSCFILEGKTLLQAALWDLHRLLSGWVTPRLAVGPSARQHLDLEPANVQQIRRQVATLPPLPSDWQPDDVRQQALYRMLRSS